ncbi:MAG: response regulator [Clostridia bacterium]|nr:response regulator [Clostridia bacterium]
MFDINFENGMYIVGRDYCIRYANDALKNFFPKVVEGAICYKTIAERDTPCTFCPITNNLEKGKLLFNSPNFSRYGAAFTNIDTPEFKECYSVMIQEIASPNMASSFTTDEMQAFLLQQKELKNRNEIIQTLSEEYSAIYFIYEEDGVFKCTKNYDESTSNSFSTADIAISSYDAIFMNYAKEHVHPDDKTLFLEGTKMEKVLASGFHEGKPYELNYRETNNNETQYMQIRFIPVKNSENAKVIVAFRCIDNIVEQELTQRQRISAALDDAQQRLRVIEGLCIEYESLYYVNAKKDIGVPYILSDQFPEEFKVNLLKEIPYTVSFHSYLDMCLAPNQREYVKAQTELNSVTERLRENPCFRINYEVPYEGKILHYQIYIARIGEAHEQVWAFKSIEETVKEQLMQHRTLVDALDKAKHAEQAKSNFLFNMSHDIRTPMNAILGFNTIAEKNIDNKEIALDALKKAKNSGEHMLSIINNVLDMARIGSGKLELNREVVDFSELINKLKEMFTHDMEQKGIKFNTSATINTPLIYTNSLRISQIIINLLSNALKFTNSGGTITYQVTELKSPDDNLAYFQVRIEDTGVGMSEEFQKHLFNAFEREYNTTQSGVQGTGLGLAITKNLVNLLGGTLTYNSMLGFGTEFTFTFKADKAVEVEKKSEEAVTLLPELKGKRILIVEDNAINREIARELLEEEGFVIDEAEDGTVAVEILEKTERGYYEFVLMDIQMPIMNGYTATRKIRGSDHVDIADIPIIAMTANAFSEDRKNAFDAGMNEHIAKPLDVDILIDVLNKVYKETHNK